MRVNEVYFLIKCKILLSERKTRVLYDWLIYNRPPVLTLCVRKIRLANSSRKVSQSSLQHYLIYDTKEYFNMLSW